MLESEITYTFVDKNISVTLYKKYDANVTTRYLALIFLIFRNVQYLTQWYENKKSVQCQDNLYYVVNGRLYLYHLKRINNNYTLVIIFGSNH